MKYPCRACGLDVVILKTGDPRYPAKALCSGCAEAPARCTCPSIRQAPTRPA